MRATTNFKRISIREDLHKKLIADRDLFQKTIDGGKWSISDTIIEYKKICNLYKDSVDIKKQKKILECGCGKKVQGFNICGDIIDSKNGRVYCKDCSPIINKRKIIHILK